jgi:hypothetical protein
MNGPLKLGLFLVFFTWYSYALRWLLDMRECECARDDWRRQYLQYFFITMMALMFLTLLNITPSTKFVTAVSVLTPFIVVTYTGRLRSSVCECSAARQRDIMYWVSIAQIIGIILWVLIKK